ncbi:MAG: CHAD domain-containing protein [Magnetococcales bacterium]|nr:CHAD domain-containing protein [Magnetococcales bacterium]
MQHPVLESANNGNHSINGQGVHRADRLHSIDTRNQEAPAMKAATMTSKMTVDDAFASILTANYEYMQGFLDMAYNRESIRGVHQTRVSFRRMRSALSVFRKAIPKDATLDMGTEMKWFASELGNARDTDVFIDEGLGDPDIKGKIGPESGETKMMDLAVKKDEEAYVRVRAAIDSDRFKAFRTDFVKWIEDRGWRTKMDKKTRKKLDQSVGDFARKTLTKRFNKILAMGENITELPEETLHEIRIECKKMRYSMEFFTPLYDQDAMKEFTTKFKSVQRQLGVINDVAVMPTVLERIMEGQDDAEVREFANGVAEQRRSQQAAAIAALPGCWEDLAAVRIPWLADEPVNSV